VRRGRELSVRERMRRGARAFGGADGVKGEVSAWTARRVLRASAVLLDARV
jgi:hypothetical protein